MIQNVHTDNGSEFHDHFEHAIKHLGLTIGGAGYARRKTMP